MFIVRYFIRCHSCGELEQLYEAPVDTQARQSYLDFPLPNGWHEGARDHYYCPRHVVVVAVMVDGKPA